MRLLRLIALLVLLPPLFLLAAVELFGDGLARRVVAALTEELHTEVRVGSYDLSLLRSFPHFSAQLHEVAVMGSDGEPLLEVERLACLLDLTSLLSRPHITRIAAYDGKLHLYTDPDGNTNYLIIPQSVGDQAEYEGAAAGAVEFGIEETILENILLTYQDERLGIDATGRIHRAELGGDFGAERYQLRTDGALIVDYLDRQGRRYLENRPLDLAGMLTVDHARGSYTLSPLMVGSGGLDLRTEGSITPTDEGMGVQLTLSSHAGSLGELAGLLPLRYADYLSGTDRHGRLALNAEVAGSWTEATYPDLHGRLSYRGRDFDLRLEMEGLAEPTIILDADGRLPLAALLEDAEGELVFDELHLGGNYADLQRPYRARRIRGSGSVELHDGFLTTASGQEVRLAGGELTVDGSRLTLTGMEVSAGGNRFTLNTTVANPYPFIFAYQQGTGDRALRFDAKVDATQVKVNELLELWGTEDEGTGEEGTTGTYDGTVALTAENWTYGEIRGSDFRGTVEINPGKLAVSGTTQSAGGTFSGEATTYLGTTDVVQARLEAADVDARELFRQWENFGQEVLMAEHVTGRMNARLLLDLPLDSMGAVVYETLSARAWLEILDGELHDFPMLENFAFALKTRDLERVRFSRLANYLEVSDGTVYLPAMLIRSSALTLALSGSHSFEQELDYAIRVNAGQVLTNKLRRHDRALEVLPARNGLFDVFYTVRGPLEDYRVETDRPAVLEAFARSRRRQARLARELKASFQRPILLELGS